MKSRTFNVRADKLKPGMLTYRFGWSPATVLSITIVGPPGYVENPTHWCYADWLITFLVGDKIVSEEIPGNRRLKVLKDD